jgi:hypothetical protein
MTPLHHRHTGLLRTSDMIAIVLAVVLILIVAAL